MKKLTRVAAALMLGASLTTGIAAAQQNASVDTTGPDSKVEIEVELENKVDIDNDTNLRANNNNPQDAESGNVRAARNTNVGSATSGNATNESQLNASAHVDNAVSAEAAADALGGGDWEQNANVENTGPDSEVEIDYEVKNTFKVTNNTNIEINNNNDQDATSGDVTVRRNTNSGHATSGDAYNSSEVNLEFDVVN